MRILPKGGPTLPLLLLCLQGITWSLSLSKVEVKETEIAEFRDSVYFRNESNRPVRIQALQIVLENSEFPDFELSIRAGLPPTDLCFGRGMGTCIPASEAGVVVTGWTIPARDSLLVFDFNLAECVRCPVGLRIVAGRQDTLRVPLIFLNGNSKDTLVLVSRLGASRRPVEPKRTE